MQRQLNRQDAQPTEPTFILSRSRASSAVPNEEELTTVQETSPTANLPTVPGRSTDIQNLLNSGGSIPMPTHPMDPPFPPSDASGLERLGTIRAAGSVSSGITPMRKLDGIELTTDEIQELFNE
jgi:hypothetical protein